MATPFQRGEILEASGYKFSIGMQTLRPYFLLLTPYFSFFHKLFHPFSLLVQRTFAESELKNELVRILMNGSKLHASKKCKKRTFAGNESRSRTCSDYAE